MSRKILISLFILVAAAANLAAGSVTLRVSPQRGKSQIDVGDMFYVIIEVANIDAEPTKPNIPGGQLVYFDQTGTSSSFSSVNGRTTQSFTATYTATARAKKEGNYTFGPITVGGVKSNTVKYNIGAAMPSQQPQPGVGGQQSQQQGSADDNKPKSIGKGDENLFLRASVSSTSAYEQQALVYTVKLYSTYTAIKFIGATESPKFDGFVVEESKDISDQLSFETYQGKQYATAVIARYIIFPQMTGNLKVTGNKYTISVDRREYYHDPFWGSLSYSTPLQLNVSPNDLVVSVKELPFPKPSNFSGAVGRFDLKSQLNASSFKTNQAASIVYTLSGTGNIKYAQLPDLSALYPPELEIYTPTTKQDVQVGSSSVSGKVTFDYSFMPLEEGTFKIPEVKFVYFDPQTGKYETSVARGYDITVGKGAAVKDDNKHKRLRFDSTLQKVDKSQLRKSIEPWVYTFGFWLWFIVPTLLLLAAVIIVRYYVSTHADMAAFNSRRADKLARRRLRKAGAALRRHDRELFYDELLTALWGYVGDKLKMPTSELLRDNIRQVLTERNIDQQAVDSFISVIDEAEFAKYSSAGSDDNMNKAYDDAAAVINQLERQFKTNKQPKEQTA